MKQVLNFLFNTNKLWFIVALKTASFIVPLMTQLATSKIFSVNAVNKIEIVKELVALKNTVKERTFNS